MGEWFRATALSGSLALAIPVALLAGLVSFFSPCVIPLLPGYLSYATGLSGADLARGDVAGGARRGRMVAGSLLFVAGFGVLFVLLGIFAGSFADWFYLNLTVLNTVLGVVCVAMGLAFLGAIPLLQRDVRVHKVPAVGLAAAPVLGFLFGVGWTPCIGPTLGVVLSLAAYQDGSAGRGGLLLGAYTVGLGLPFVLAGLAWHRALGALSFVRRHQQWVTRAGGLMLVLVGVALLTGWWDVAVQWLQIHLVNDYTVGV